MTLPTEAEIYRLHQTYAPTDEVRDLVLGHSLIDWAIAEQLISAGELSVDPTLVKLGCLVHDLGVYLLYDHEGNYREGVEYITHGILGEALLKELGLPEVVWRFASHHTGVGLTKDDIERQNLPLPHQDYLAQSIEEKLVMYADKFHSKRTPPGFNSFDAYAKKAAAFGPAVAERFQALAEEFGKPELESLAEQFGQRIDE